jgi:hypothetical protein
MLSSLEVKVLWPTCHDITSGNNGDYQAGPGWDACTGWGSPNGTAILQALAGTSPDPTPTPAPVPPSKKRKRKKRLAFRHSDSEG